MIKSIFVLLLSHSGSLVVEDCLPPAQIGVRCGSFLPFFVDSQASALVRKLPFQTNVIDILQTLPNKVLVCSPRSLPLSGVITRGLRNFYRMGFVTPEKEYAENRVVGKQQYQQGNQLHGEIRPP